MPRLKRLFLVPLAALAFAPPAAAQFGTIFGGPPRPPADVPTRDPRLPVDPRLPTDVDPRFDPRQPAPQPPPPPLTRFPSGPPPGIQTQPLPPPPGSIAAPPRPRDDLAGRPPAGDSGPAALPGLPPGQRQPRGQPTPPGAPAAPPSDEVVVAPPAQKVVNPTAVFAGLDKITGRIISFDVSIDETVQFGALRLTPRACYTRPPTETPNTDGFIEVDEITLQGEVKRIFTGWMCAASPGLHGVEHPIYDVWLTDCKKEAPQVAGTPGPQAQQTEPVPAQAAPAQAAPAQPPPMQQPAQRPPNPPPAPRR